MASTSQGPAAAAHSGAVGDGPAGVAQPGNEPDDEWQLVHGAGEPAASSHIRGASQLVGSPVCGLPYSSASWHYFFDVLSYMAASSKADFNFCSEQGRMFQGIAAAGVDFGKIVHAALPGARSVTSGAYASIWNITPNHAAHIQHGIYRVPAGIPVDLHWQAFFIQSENNPVGLIVGNLHIVARKNIKSTITTRRRAVVLSLNYLASLVGGGPAGAAQPGSDPDNEWQLVHGTGEPVADASGWLAFPEQQPMHLSREELQQVRAETCLDHIGAVAIRWQN
jgi:hypothetical protein